MINKILILLAVAVFISALSGLWASIMVKRSLKKIEKELDDDKNFTEHIESID